MEGLTRGGRRLFLLIHRFIHKRGSFHAGQEWIANDLKTSKRSVKRWTAELISKKYITHTCGKQASASYTIIRQLPANVAPHWHLNWPLSGTSLAPLIKEEPFNSLRELNSEEKNLLTRKPAAFDATDRLASKNAKSKIAAMVRSSNQMPIRKLPPQFRSAAAGRSG